jgi:hypothetical protein
LGSTIAQPFVSVSFANTDNAIQVMNKENNKVSRVESGRAGQGRVRKSWVGPKLFGSLQRNSKTKYRIIIPMQVGKCHRSPGGVVYGYRNAFSCMYIFVRSNPARVVVVLEEKYGQ